MPVDNNWAFSYNGLIVNQVSNKYIMNIEFKNGKFHAIVNGKIVASSPNKNYLKQKIAKLGVTEAAAPVEDNAALKFPINQRFESVERLVRMVGSGSTASAIITGDGGLGKSHSVVAALKTAGLRDITEIEPGTVINSKNCFRIVKGYSTARGLFRILWENRNNIVVFDDCDSILRDEDAVNILKGALDSYDKRLITWNSMRPDDEMPRTFQFEGGIVFISNRSINKIDQALRTRSMCIDLSMTLDQKIERMDVIMRSAEFLPNVLISHKRDALNLINKYKDQAKEVSLRTLIAVSKIRAQNDADWADLATYSLIA